MANVFAETSQIMMNKYFNKAIIIFLSKVFIKRLKEPEKVYFRKVEKSLKIHTKINADLRFLNEHLCKSVFQPHLVLRPVNLRS